MVSIFNLTEGHFGTYVVNLVVCHELYGRIGENPEQRRGVALEQPANTLLLVDFVNCAKGARPCSCTATASGRFEKAISRKPNLHISGRDRKSVV